MNPKDLNPYFEGFSKLTFQERCRRLIAMGALDPQDVQYLKRGGLKEVTLGEKFVENVIGYMQLPLGVAINFNIDGKDHVIPMAVEETSIIAAASKTAKWVRAGGSIETEVVGSDIIGQIQVGRVSNFEKFKTVIESYKDSLIQMANSEVATTMANRGGGVRDIVVRKLKRPDGQDMAVLHVHADMCNAMGANMINQVCEFLKNPVEVRTGERVTMCILSNLVDTKLTRCRVTLKNIDPELGMGIEEASLFAEMDPYRAATNNKGVLNGIDPVLIATGNDWRAVEAGVHAYAARDGQYRSITKWQMRGQDLVGEFEAPIIVGTVGGVTHLHPTAQLAIRMLGVSGANDLSRICAAVGLVQNLGALRALTTFGIIEGHMKLHIKNLSLGAGADESEMPELQKRLEQLLAARKRITLTNAVEILLELRTRAKGGSTPASAQA